MDTTTALIHFATALAIGLLLGLEREHSTSGERFRPAGSRTFSLLAVAGAASAALGIPVLVTALAAASALVIAWYVLAVRASAEEEAGATTEIAAITAVLLGALSWTRPTWAVPIAVAVVALLAAKRPLRRFATRLVTDQDVADAVRLFVVAFVVYPLLPDRAMGPYGVLNPSRIWLLVVAITVIGWAGYVAARALGERRGLLVVGFLGGFVSASATTVVLARRSARDVPAAVLPAVLAASIATLVQLIAVTAVANPAVAVRLLPAAARGSWCYLPKRGGCSGDPATTTGRTSRSRIPARLRPAPAWIGRCRCGPRSRSPSCWSFSCSPPGRRPTCSATAECSPPRSRADSPMRTRPRWPRRPSPERSSPSAPPCSLSALPCSATR